MAQAMPQATQQAQQQAQQFQPWDIWEDDKTGRFSYLSPQGKWEAMFEVPPKNVDAAKQYRDAVRQVFDAGDKPTTVTGPNVGAQAVNPRAPLNRSPQPLPPEVVAGGQAVAQPEAATPAGPGESFPGMLARTAQDYWAEVPGVGGSAMRGLAALAPESWAGTAGLAASFVPGGVFARLLYPTIAGTVAGTAAPDETALGGGATGAIAGLGGAIGGKVMSAATGAGKVAWKESAKFFQRAGDRIGPPLANALQQSLPILQKAKVKLSGTGDVYNLLTEKAERQVGKVFDSVEKRIAKTMGDKSVEMPVLQRQHATTTASSPRTTRTTSEGTVRSDITKETELLSTPDDPIKVVRTQTSGSQGPATRVTQTDPGVRRGVTRTVTGEDVVYQPMTIAQAIRLKNQYRTDKSEAGQQLYHEAARALNEGITRVSPKLGKEYTVLREDFSKFMDFRRAMGQPENTFPGRTGLSPLDFYNNLIKNPHLVSRDRFPQLFQFLEGQANRGPMAEKIAALPFYAHPAPGVPVGVHMGAKGGSGQQLPRELSELLARVAPGLAKRLQQAGTLAGARTGAAIGDLGTELGGRQPNR